MDQGELGQQKQKVVIIFARLLHYKLKLVYFGLRNAAEGRT